MTESGVGFLRYARLFSGLPPSSRIMEHLNPAGSWGWPEETNAQILQELSRIKTILYNSNRPKGAKALTTDELLQPEYVKEAKEEYLKQIKDKATITDDDIADMEAFWKARNPNVKGL